MRSCISIVERLKHEVEELLDDHMISFQDFLGSEAGDFLNITSDAEGKACVELVNESLRSFLISGQCPREFFVDVKAAELRHKRLLKSIPGKL